jgi:hypothetical protein
MQKWMTVRKLRTTLRLCKMWRRCMQKQKCRTNTTQKRRRQSKLFIY